MSDREILTICGALSKNCELIYPDDDIIGGLAKDLSNSIYNVRVIKWMRHLLIHNKFSHL